MQTVSGQSRGASQAYQILRAGMTVAPIFAGVDKFLDYLTDWEQYLAPQVQRRAHMSPRRFMRGVGLIEIAAGLLTAFRPRLGGYVVAGWLAGIIGDLVIGRRDYDVALRDFGLLLGALALARLSAEREELRRQEGTGAEESTVAVPESPILGTP